MIKNIYGEEWKKLNDLIFAYDKTINTNKLWAFTWTRSYVKESNLIPSEKKKRILTVSNIKTLSSFLSDCSQRLSRKFIKSRLSSNKSC